MIFIVGILRMENILDPGSSKIGGLLVMTKLNAEHFIWCRNIR